MSLRSASVRGSLVLTVGEAASYGLSFVRNMILARMLTKADFGIAAAFAMIITLLEFSAKLGMSRFVVRDKEGDRPDFLAAAHLVQGGVAVLSCLVILAGAWPMARLFGIADHINALYLLSAIPLLNGFAHLDVKRYERNLRFGPSMLVETIPQAVITLAAWPVAAWLGDYRTVVVLLIVKAVCSSLGSHWLAEQRYRWQLHREYVTRMLRFGWPLIVNSFLMFGVLQGDQFLVASFYTMSDLGAYAAAAALTMAPTFFFGRVFGSITLPVMAKVQDDQPAFERRYRLIVAVLCVFSTVYSVGVIVGSEALMQIVYGHKYAGSGIILGWLAASNSFRNIRVAPAVAAMSRGDSVNQMMSNLARVVALAPALAVALAGYPTWMMACMGLVGEVLACTVSFRRLSRIHFLPLSVNLRPTALVTCVLLLSGGASYLGVQRLHPAVSLVIAALGAVGGGIIVLILLEDSRREALRVWSQLRGTGWRQWLAVLRGVGTGRTGQPPVHAE